MNTSFDLLDDIMIDLDLDREISFGELILDESIDPITSSCERGIKRERSQTEVVQSVTDSEDGITEDERDELKEFLQGIGFLETPRSSIVTPNSAGLASGLHSTSHTPSGRWSPDYSVASPEKRRRVTPPAPVVTAQYTQPKVNQPTSHKRENSKTRTTRQYVPFEEMQRLMLVYGPIKTPRKSKCYPDECGTAGNVKADSIRRKFYRWFPDFETRFVRNTDSMSYKPLAGHDEEVAYRRTMRENDKEILVYKRKVGRRN
jgi:hypothetical protein